MNPCSKSCAECRERNTCEGCAKFAADCPVARCCNEKGHENCSTCTDNASCAVRRSCYSMPNYRREKAEEERIRVERYRELRGNVLKYLRPLFIAALITEVFLLLPTDKIIERLPETRFLFAAVLLILRSLCGFFLIKLGSANEKYKKAGVLTVVYGVASAFITAFTTPVTSTAVSVLAFFAAVLMYVSIWLEYTAHSDILAGVDDTLGDKWTVLFKWRIGATVAGVASPLLVLTVPFLGALVVITAMLALAVTDVMYFVYLNSTIQDFTYEEL